MQNSLLRSLDRNDLRRALDEVSRELDSTIGDSNAKVAVVSIGEGSYETFQKEGVYRRFKKSDFVVLENDKPLSLVALYRTRPVKEVTHLCKIAQRVELGATVEYKLNPRWELAPHIPLLSRFAPTSFKYTTLSKLLRARGYANL